MKGLLKVRDIILKQCCIVMNYTLNQFRPIYHQAISDVNENGIRAALWAKRGDILTDEFMSDDTVKVLHIKRGNLWQIDPVADLENGDLYILINKNVSIEHRHVFLFYTRTRPYSSEGMSETRRALIIAIICGIAVQQKAMCNKA